jgi:hypothetical protein
MSDHSNDAVSSKEEWSNEYSSEEYSSEEDHHNRLFRLQLLCRQHCQTNYIISSLFFDILVLDSIFLSCYFHLHLQYMTMPIW